MKRRLSCSGLLFALLGLTAAAASADDIRFTAYGAAGYPYAGATVGYVDYDHATLLSQITAASPWNAVFAANTAITALSFEDLQPPGTAFGTADVNRAGSSIAFMRDANGTPIVAGGGDWLVQYFDASGWRTSGLTTWGGGIEFRWGGHPGMDPYVHGYAVSWTTSMVSPPVPEPGTAAMLLAGLGGLGAMARRRARQAG